MGGSNKETTTSAYSDSSNEEPKPRGEGEDLANVASTLASFKSYHFARKVDDNIKRSIDDLVPKADLVLGVSSMTSNSDVDRPSASGSISVINSSTKSLSDIAVPTKAASSNRPGGRKRTALPLSLGKVGKEFDEKKAPMQIMPVESLPLATFRDRGEDFGKIGKGRRKAQALKEAEKEKEKMYAASLGNSLTGHTGDSILQSPARSHRNTEGTSDATSTTPSTPFSYIDRNLSLPASSLDISRGGSRGNVVSSSASPTLSTRYPDLPNHRAKRPTQENESSGHSSVEIKVSEHNSRKKKRIETISSVVTPSVVSPGFSKKNKGKESDKETERKRLMGCLPSTGTTPGTSGSFCESAALLDGVASNPQPIGARESSFPSKRNRSTAKKRAEENMTYSNEMQDVESLLRKQFEAHTSALKVAPPRHSMPFPPEIASQSQLQGSRSDKRSFQEEIMRSQAQRDDIENNLGVGKSSDLPAMHPSEILRLVHELHKGTTSMSIDKIDSSESSFARLMGGPISQSSECSNRARNLQPQLTTAPSPRPPPSRNVNEIGSNSQGPAMSAAAALASVLNDESTRASAAATLPYMNTNDTSNSPTGNGTGMMNPQVLLNLIKQGSNNVENSFMPPVNIAPNKNTIMAQALLDSLSNAMYSRQNDVHQTIPDSSLQQQLASLGVPSTLAKQAPSSSSHPLFHLLAQLGSSSPNGVASVQSSLQASQWALQQQQQQQKQPSDSLVTQMILAQLGLGGGGGNAKEGKPVKGESVANEGDKMQQQLLQIQRLMQLSDHRDAENERRAPPTDNVLRQNPMLGQLLQNQIRAQQNQGQALNHMTHLQNPVMQLLQSSAAGASGPSRLAAPTSMDNNSALSNLLAQALLQKQQQQPRPFQPPLRMVQQQTQIGQSPSNLQPYTQQQFSASAESSPFLGRPSLSQQRHQQQAGLHTQQQQSTIPLHVLEAILRAQNQG